MTQLIGSYAAEMGDIFTSDFHKTNIKKVVFTKEYFTPGTENSIVINPTFKPGDAIIATIYLPASPKYYNAHVLYFSKDII